MKKTIFILSLVTLFTLIGIGLAVTVSAEVEIPTSGKLGADVYWSLDITTGELTISGSGAMDEDVLVAPLYIVNDLIKKASIENGITSIGEAVFLECYNLTAVNIPESVTYIGDSAFSGCSGLTEIIIPQGATYLGCGAFSGCSGLTDIDIPESVTYIDSGAFSGCSGLTEIYIPDGVTYIGDGAFSECSGLTKINVPKSVTFIGSGAFRYTNIETITLETGIKQIGSYTFQYCYNLKSVNILGEITSIGNEAFEYCTSLESITIPPSLTYIGMESFDNCTSLKSMYISDLVSWLKVDLNYAVTTPLQNGADLYLNGQLVTDLVIPSIPYAYKLGVHFSGCTSIRSVVIPNNIEYISGSFKNCVNLTSVTIPNSVTDIGTNTFENCTSLTSITLPDSIKKVDMYTFKNCTSLKEIRLPVGTTEISSDAFNGCTALTTLYIPSTMTNIWYGAFENCTALQTIYYCGTEDSWESIEKSDTWNNGAGQFSIVHHHRILESVDDKTHRHVCDICGDAIVSDHVIGSWVKHDGDTHKAECECGYAQYAEHEFGEWTVTAEPTDNSDGKRERTCGCGYKASELIPSTGSTQTEESTDTHTVVKDPDETKKQQGDDTSTVTDGTQDDNGNTGCGATVSVGILWLMTVSAYAVSRKKKLND